MNNYDIPECIPRVKIQSGRKGHSLRFFLNGKEIPVEKVETKLEHGCMGMVTVTFSAIINQDNFD